MWSPQYCKNFRSLLWWGDNQGISEYKFIFIRRERETQWRLKRSRGKLQEENQGLLLCYEIGWVWRTISLHWAHRSIFWEISKKSILLTLKRNRLSPHEWNSPQGLEAWKFINRFKISTRDRWFWLCLESREYWQALQFNCW